MLREISVWFSQYEHRLPNAPKPNMQRLLRLNYKGTPIVRVPLHGSEGSIYFAKTNDSTLDVQFIRIVPKDNIIKFPFSGAYEYIDMNSFDYRRVTYVNGLRVNTRISLQNSNKAVVAQNPDLQVKTATSWLSQFFWCVGHYILAIPKKDANGDWSECWVPGASNPSPEQPQDMQPGDGGGGGTESWSGISWSTFYESNIPPNGSSAASGGSGGSSGGSIGTSSESGVSVEEDEAMTNENINQDIVDYFFEFAPSPKSRPSYVSMKNNALPSSTTWNYAQVADYLGNEVKTILYIDRNTCATRVSHMLNQSGNLIPSGPWATFLSSSNKNYIVHALTMLNYLKSSFGTSATNTIHLESAPNAPLTKTQIINALNGKQGIYALIPVDPSKATGFGASGHIDLLDKDGTLVSGHNYFFANGGVKEIYLFILD